MAKKRSNSKKVNNNLSFSLHPLMLGLVLSVIVGVVGGMAYLYGAEAAPPAPTGSFVTQTPSALKANDTFTSQYETGNIKGKGYAYQTLVCWHQDEAGETTVVKQESYRDNPKTWALVKSASSQFPVWDTTKEAQCQLDLIYRVDGGGKNGSTIVTLASQSFTVSPL